MAVGQWSPLLRAVEKGQSLAKLADQYRRPPMLCVIIMILFTIAFLTIGLYCISNADNDTGEKMGKN